MKHEPIQEMSVRKTTNHTSDLSYGWMETESFVSHGIQIREVVVQLVVRWFSTEG